ncbi:hypothetical protein GF420_10950 [candidate division GN15 bacterium]|nr:hypothetical protein [candidate division GN15 bacterium]
MNHLQFAKAFLLTLPLLIFIPACEHENGDAVTGAYGTVLDSLTGLPIEGAEIFETDTIGGEPVYITDSTGFSRTGWFGIADRTIYCLADGYRTQSRRITEDGRMVGVDFELYEE